MKKTVFLYYIVLICCLAGILLRIYSLDFFEFKADQARAVLSGDYVLKKCFFIFHGMMSGVGLPNPPGFYWGLGFFAIFGSGAVYFASIFLILSIIFPLVLFSLFRTHSTRETVLVATALAATSPILIVFSCNIWAQCVMPLFAAIVIWLLVCFVEKQQDCYWTLAIIATLLAGSIHISGLFLLPVVVLTALRKRPGVQSLVLSAMAGLIIFGGWIIFLLKNWNWKLFPSEQSYFEQLRYSLQNIFFFPSNFFMISYFPNDFIQIIKFYAGNLNSWLLLLCGTLPIWIFFIVGISAYLKLLAHNHYRLKLNNEAIPLLIQIATFTAISVPLSYLLTEIKVHIFYLLVASPAFFLVCGYGFRLIQNRPFKYALLILFLTATLTNSGLFLRYIDYSGGHPDEYGPSYAFLNDIVSNIAALSENSKVNLKINVKGRARKKCDALAFEYLFLRFHDPSGLPLYVDIRWNEDEMRFEYSLSAPTP